MQYFTKNPTGLRLFSNLSVLMLSIASIVWTASAQASTTTKAGRLELAAAQGANSRKTVRAVTAPAPYFIEFRARYALSYGHTFAMFGRLNARGEIIQREVAGLHPAGNSPVPWMIGHVVPVASETGPSDGDLEEKYVSARYRLVLKEAEYTKLTAFIKKLQASSPLWSAVAYNCNAFVADIAKFMGLETPSSTLLYPADFINKLRDLNVGRERAASTEAPPVQ
ncbi:hypothetical protein [Microvirga alba]|uniref:DUF4105 domain-containing protein n=1 Tax=Microvirga alba TaxID=2791025 RepID=A0A931BJU2_9HYPH|nr:hypothetical protein [Microvirga alba]MBF9232287.1 hypothetical protein [Microvirga alba]